MQRCGEPSESIDLNGFLVQNRPEIVPRTIKNELKIVPKPRYLARRPPGAIFGHPLDPQGRPKAAPRRPKAAQGWAQCRAWLLQGLHFGVIFWSTFVFFLGFVFGSVFLWLGRRFRYHFAFISEVIFHVFSISAKNAGPYEYAAPADQIKGRAPRKTTKKPSQSEGKNDMKTEAQK